MNSVKPRILLTMSAMLAVSGCAMSPPWFENDGYKINEHIGVMSSCGGQGPMRVCSGTVLESDGNMPGLPRAVVRDEGQKRALQADPQ
jgi:hypothetical protein